VSNKWKRFEFGPRYPLSNYVLGKYDVPCYYGINSIDHKVGFKIENKNDSVEIWGAQLEDRPSWSDESPKARSYIPTAGTTGYRASDILTLEPAFTTGWMGVTFTIIYETENSFGGAFTIRRDASNDYITTTLRSDQNVLSYRYINPSSFIYPGSANSFVNGARSPISKVAMLLAGPTFGVYNEGVGTQTGHGFSGQTLPFTRFYFAHDASNFSLGTDTAYLRQFRYWNQIFSESDIKQTTATYVDPYKWILNPYG
jgi:hypothetical protein